MMSPCLFSIYIRVGLHTGLWCTFFLIFREMARVWYCYGFGNDVESAIRHSGAVSPHRVSPFGEDLQRTRSRGTAYILGSANKKPYI